MVIFQEVGGERSKGGLYIEYKGGYVAVCTCELTGVNAIEAH